MQILRPRLSIVEGAVKAAMALPALASSVNHLMHEMPSNVAAAAIIERS